MTELRAPRSAPLSERAWHGALFAALLLLLLLFAPGTNRWMGYSQEENDAALALVDRLTGADSPREASIFSRHGFIATLFRLPFAAAARTAEAIGGSGRGSIVRGEGGFLSSGRSPAGEALLGLEPQIATAALATLFALWLNRLVRSRRRALLWTLAVLFTTPLWPYAYLGLETTQSLLLFVAGFLALAPISRWRLVHDVGFVAALALAGSAKTTSLFYWPLLLWLIVRVERRRRSAPEAPRRSILPWAIGALLATRLASFAAIDQYRQHAAEFFPGASLGGAFRALLVPSPFELAEHLNAMLFSWNKGWFVFAPLALAGLVVSVAGAYGGSRSDIRTFAWSSWLLLALGFGAMIIWSEETWGPRYLQSAVAPAVLALALVRATGTPVAGAVRRRLGPWLLVVLAVAGLCVNALGVAVHYGTLYKATLAAGENTLEAVQYDPAWNHPRFNAWVFREWARHPRDAGVSAPPFPIVRHSWWFEVPESMPPARAVKIGEGIRPQPLVLRLLVGGESPALRPAAWAQLLAGALGGLLLMWLYRRDR